VDGVVVLSPFYWNFRDDIPLTTQHIAREFARHLPTVLVEPPAQWNPRSEQFRLHRLVQSVLPPRARSPHPGLTVFHRRALPLGRFAALRAADAALNARPLARQLGRMGLRRPLLWHSFPFWSEHVTAAADWGRFVYHCLDHSSRPEETALIRRADAVFCVSEALVARHRALNPRTFLLPNGVDLELFDRARAAQAPPPADLPARGRRIGFLGSINCHLDLELMTEVARAFPDDSLVMMGRVHTNETAPRGRQREALRTLEAMPNVTFLGFKPTRELPLYLHAFDVCLIPFLDNAFNRECDPLKFYEYAAMGKPVVATRVPAAVDRYRDVCHLASSRPEFVAAVREALAEPDAERRAQARVEIARAHGWGAVVAQAGRVLEAAAEREPRAREQVG
jgi:glycosyltransferase involved in cell wall biosynthesis